jgi:hypothetical protein
MYRRPLDNKALRSFSNHWLESVYWLRLYMVSPDEFTYQRFLRVQSDLGEDFTRFYGLRGGAALTEILTTYAEKTRHALDVARTLQPMDEMFQSWLQAGRDVADFFVQVLGANRETLNAIFERTQKMLIKSSDSWEMKMPQQSIIYFDEVITATNELSEHLISSLWSQWKRKVPLVLGPLGPEQHRSLPS